VLLQALWSLLLPRSPETQALFAQLDQQLQTQPSSNLVTLGTMQWLQDWLVCQQQLKPPLPFVRAARLHRVLELVQ
jgi:hypothetical protein